MSEYEDIMDKHRPVSKHKSMSIADRAKIFSPFAALTGFEDAIEEKNIVKQIKTELSDEQKNELDIKFGKISHMLEKDNHPIVTVVYFIKDKETKEDICLKKTGMVAKIEIESGYIQIVEEKIKFEDLYSIAGEELT